MRSYIVEYKKYINSNAVEMQMFKKTFADNESDAIANILVDLFNEYMVNNKKISIEIESISLLN